MPHRYELAIIIPVRNEEHTVGSVLRSLARQTMLSRCQVIVVDGMSEDNTAAVAASFPFVQVVSSSPGRAKQMNLGARHAAAPALWFLHADSTLPDSRTIEALLHALEDPAVVGGAFRFRLRGNDFYYRFINWMVNLRSVTVHRVYGDQGIFVRTALFHELGGFREIGFCEDVDLVLRLRGNGRFVILPLVVETSARTWIRYGKLRTTWYHVRELLRYEWLRRTGRLETLIANQNTIEDLPPSPTPSP
ncbi:MAG: TIGR04283 family arsenosugar biosynthesis glycosyltransferase [Candidatus Sumerlaeaceae bacterium]|nr:TIGR04283 family arsenosugar biosynthesis glycosyltransferase [Candidatus Sumerlaeaceae bacterium]